MGFDFGSDWWKGPAAFQAETYKETDASSVANPAGRLSEMAVEQGQDELSLLLDPMDLFGARAKGAATDIKGILTQSAQESIARQEEQEKMLRARYEPYYQGAVGEGGGLQAMEAMATGGEMDYTPSRLFEYQKRKGLEGIDVSQAKRGLLHSSATETRKGELMGGLAAEEAGRAYGGQLSRVQLGAGAAGAVSAAGSAVSGNIGSLYSNLASGLNATQQAYGQAREAAFSTAGNTMGNLAAYQMQQG